MKKHSIDSTIFPGQQIKTVTVYIKQKEQEHYIQMSLPLFNEDDEPAFNQS